jgi:hypothetical protein
MGNNWQLFADIVDAQRDPPMSRKKETTVGHVERDEKNELNRLVNDEGSIWLAQVNGESLISARKGDSIPLLPGTMIHFGENRRLLVVEE